MGMAGGEIGTRRSAHRAVPKTSYTAGDIVGLIGEQVEKAEEGADEMSQMPDRIEAAEAAAGQRDDGDDLGSRVSDLESAVGSGGDKGDVADRDDDLEGAVESVEAKKESLQDRVYRLESGIVRMPARLARLERR